MPDQLHQKKRACVLQRPCREFMVGLRFKDVTLDPSTMCGVMQSRKNSGEKEKKGNEASKESKGKTHTCTSAP